jgi:hypothetical protein
VVRRRSLLSLLLTCHSISTGTVMVTIPLSSIAKRLDSSNDSTLFYALLRSKHVLNVSTGPPRRLLYVRYAYISSNTPAICLSIARVLYCVSVF